MKFRHYLCASVLLAGCATAQTGVRIDPATGGWGWLTRPYQTRSVPPISLSNSSRLESLVRAGNLYLSAQDAVALAIENNIDVEVQRYGPLLAREVLRRAQGGGALRSVGLGVAPGPAERQPAGRQRERERSQCERGRRRREFGRRHRHAAWAGDSVARSHRDCFREFPALEHTRRATPC